MFMPLFKVTYQPVAEAFCNILLQVAAFEAIDAEPINDVVWGDSSSKSVESESTARIGRFENLGYEGPNSIPNLASTLIMLSILLSLLMPLVYLSRKKKCCTVVQSKRGELQGMLNWNMPIAFLLNSYSVCSICCLLNLKYANSTASLSASANLIASLLLLILLVSFPVAQVICLRRNKD